MLRFVARCCCGWVTSLCWPPATADAQRGEFIEGLFRTIAEAQLERERAKQAERRRQETAKKAAESGGRDPYEVQLPSGFGRGGSLQGNPSTRNPSPSQRPPVGLNPNLRTPNQRSSHRSINVRSREAAEFVGTLVKFNTGLDSLFTICELTRHGNSACGRCCPKPMRLRPSLRRCWGNVTDFRHSVQSSILTGNSTLGGANFRLSSDRPARSASSAGARSVSATSCVRRWPSNSESSLSWIDVRFAT